MAIETVVTRGYGTFGSVNLVVTRGYAVGVAAPAKYPSNATIESDGLSSTIESSANTSTITRTSLTATIQRRTS